MKLKTNKKELSYKKTKRARVNHRTKQKKATDCQTALDRLLLALNSDPILNLPNFSEKFVLRTECFRHCERSRVQIPDEPPVCHKYAQCARHGTRHRRRTN